MFVEEHELIRSQKDEALKLLQAARIALLNNYPFYGTLVSSLPLVADWDWLPTAATDHRHLFYNPEFIMGMSPERKKRVFSRIDNHPLMTQKEKDDYKEYVNVFYKPKTIKEVVFILMHEIRHITNDHLARGKAFDHKQYNAASDEYINTNLVMELGQKGALKFFPHGKQTVFEKGKEFGWLGYCYCDFKYYGKTAEQIYVLMNSGFTIKSNVGTHIGDYDPNLDILGYTSPHPCSSDVERDENLSWSADMIDAALQACDGDGPAEARELAARRGKPTINYLQIIKQRMISRIKSSLSYRRPARRSGSVTYMLRKHGAINKHQSIVLPGRNNKQTIDIVVGFDVSGSISQKTLTRIFTEISGMIALYSEFRVTLFCWSTKVGDVKVYTKANIHEMMDYKVTSTGGTSATCAFEYIEKNIPEAKEVIIFTDGYIEDLKNRQDWGRKFDTLWVICGGRSNWQAPFGRAVNLDENQR